MHSKLLPQIAIILILCVLSIGFAQQVITTTTTTVITYPPSTTTEIVEMPGTTGAATIIYGGYRLIYIEMRPDQECVMVVRGEPVTEITIPGMTFPGITTAYAIPAATYETTITSIEGGTTLKTTGMDYVEALTTISMGPISTVFSIAVPVYGEIMKYCRAITLTIINRFEAREPLTISIAMPGYTMSGTVITVPELFITEPVTVTKTTTIPGTTYTTTYEEEGRTIVTTVSAPGTTATKTITIPGSTVTKTITIESTVSGPPTKTEASTQTTGAPSKTTPATTQAPATTAAGPEMASMIPIIIIAIIIVVVIAAILVIRRSRAR